MTTLREARDKGNLDQFIKEHKADAKGDADALNRSLASMAGKVKPKPVEKPE